MFEERQWRMLTSVGLLIAFTIALMGLLDTGIERVLLLVIAGLLLLVLVLSWVYRLRGRVEHILLDGDLLTRTRRHLVGTRRHKQGVGALREYSFMAYDGRDLESRIDAWFRRANRQPDPQEYLTLLRDSGGVIYTDRQVFERGPVEPLPIWELRLTFADGQVWTWRYRSLTRRNRKALADFLEALADA